jgi:NADPH2 dehydrogenase
MTYKRIASLRTAQEFQDYLNQLGLPLGFDPEVVTGETAALAQTYTLHDGFNIGNRFCIQPMEGWDGTTDGKPSELTFRRWEHFGLSGAKLIWGCEAAAVHPDGRANPNQLIISEDNLANFRELRNRLVEVHLKKYGNQNNLMIGIQLTHSGRYCRPHEKQLPEPIILYHHPYLDAKLGLPSDYPILTDEGIYKIIRHYIHAASLAWDVGFDFVDIKHCHGYLGHEFLSAYSRPGVYGGPFENRTRFLREIVQGIRKNNPNLRIGVRLSAFDTPPFTADPNTRIGTPATTTDYPYAFGANPQHPLQPQLDEVILFIELLRSLEIGLVNITAGSPYYNPHIQRPALFPPSDGYRPPEDPLVGVNRHIQITADLKKKFPTMLFVGSGYSYLQEWLPNVAQYAVRTGQVDFVGLGRMVLSYPEFPNEILNGNAIQHRRLCRTFSDCTTAPRLGLVSGCYPIDPFYKKRPESVILEEKKLLKKL